MGAGSNNLMSTQTGGVGETIQAENTTQATPQEFQADIAPVQAETPQTEVPSEVPVEQIANEEPPPVEGPIPAEEQPAMPMVPTEEPMIVEPSAEQPMVPQAPIETETDVINRLGLENVEPAFDSANDLFSNKNVTTTPDGIPVLGSEQPVEVKDEGEAPLIQEEEKEEVLEPEFTPDGIPIEKGPQSAPKINLADINAKYKNEGIQIDDLGKLSVGVEEKKDAQGLPDGSYRLAGKSANYQKIDGKWYKDANLTGDYQPIGGDNVESRVGYLESNAQATVSETQKKANEIINQRFGDLRKEVEGNMVNETSYTFDDLTQGNIGSADEKYNSDGTINFNYVPKAETPFNATPVSKDYTPSIETAFGTIPGYKEQKNDTDGIYKFPGSNASYQRKNGDWFIDPKGGVNFVPLKHGNVALRKAKLDTDAILQSKPDGVYVYPGSKASYKRVNGDWLIDPRGGTDFVEMKEGDVAERKLKLDLGAKPAATVFDARAVMTGKEFQKGKENMNADYVAEKAQESKEKFNKAQNFTKTNLSLKLNKSLNGDQMTSLIEYQNKIKDIIGDGSYTADKSAKVAQVLKEAESYFNECKQINAEISEAQSQGRSLSQISLEKKIDLAEGLLTDKGNGVYWGVDGGLKDFSQKEMFDVTSGMASFILDNVDNGKMRYDAEAGQYVISPNVSATERQYLENKLGTFVAEYSAMQGEKYAEAQDNIQDDRQKLAAEKRNIVKLESLLAQMTRDGVDEKSEEYKAVVSELDRSKSQVDEYDALIDKKTYATDAAFLTEPKKTAQQLAMSMSEDAYTIVAAIPKDITPKQQFDLIYERLLAQNDKLAKDNNLNTEGLGNANMKVKDMLDWDGFYALSKTEKQWLQNKATLNKMASLYFNNSDMVIENGSGFWESFNNALFSTLFPNTAKAEGKINLSEASAETAQKLQEFGFKDEDFVTPDVIKKIEEQSKVDFWSAEKFGTMTGTTVAVIAPLFLTAGIPAASLRVITGLEALITGAEVTKVAKIVGTAEKIYSTALNSTRFGRFLVPVIESATKAEIAGRVFTQQKDELNFLSFMAGGVVSESLGVVFAKMPKEQVYNYLKGIFGNKIDAAINVIKKGGELTATGIGETGEETMQELVGIYQRTDSWQEMKAELDKQFGTFDQVQEFIISSFIMGAGFGLSKPKSAKEAYDKLPPESREQVDAAISAIKNDLDEADSKVEEFAENKEKQQAVEKTIEENDKKDEEGVSGQVGEGQESVEGQPVTEPSQEAPSTGGVVQEKQGQAEQVAPTAEATTETPAEAPKPQKVTARSLEEAQELVKQGYVPADKSLSSTALGNIFNTRKKLNMVRVEQAPTTDAPTAETTTEPTAEPVAESTTAEPIKNADGKTAEEVIQDRVKITRKIFGEESKDNPIAAYENEIERLKEFGDYPDKVEELQKELDFIKESQATTGATNEAQATEAPAAETTAEPVVEKTDAFKKVAAAIRKGKIDSSGMAMVGIVPTSVFNSAIEGLALTVENIGKIVENVRNSDWYKSLNEQVKKAVDRGLDKTLKSSTKESRLTNEQVANEAYKNEFKNIYDSLVYNAEKTGDINDINNLNSFVNDPRAFIEDFILGNPINSNPMNDAVGDFNLSRDKYGDYISNWEDKVRERIQKVENSLSSDRKTLANNEIISNYSNSSVRSVEHALEILSDTESTQEDIEYANEVLADPIKHFMDSYRFSNDENSKYYDPKDAARYLKEAQAVKATYEKYGVDTGLSQEQSNQIDEAADSIEDNVVEEPKLTKEQEKAKRKAEREAEKQRLKEFKENVAKATGTAKQPKTIQMTESEALRKQLKDKEKAGKETRIWMNKMRNDILDYAKKNLPKGEYTNAELNKITAALKAKDLEAALDRIDAIIAKKQEGIANRDAKTAERKRKATIKDIKNKMNNKRTILSKQGNRWVGKTTVESQKEYFKFINNVKIDELDGKTQDELDEINDIIDGIVSEGKADYKRLKELDADAKRERAAALIQGLAKGQGTTLNSVDEIMDFFDKNGQVVVDGKLYNKSSFKQLINKDTQKGKQGDKIADIEEEIEDLKRDYETRLEEVIVEGGNESTDPDLKAITKKIATKNKQLSTAQAKYDSMPDADVEITGATGYKQENAELAKLSERTRKKKFFNGVINFLTPAKAINDLYSLYTKTWSKSSAVAKFVKDNIMEPVKKAYVARDIAYSKKVNEYYKKLDEIFGTYPANKTKERAGVSARGAKGVDKLSESVDKIVTSEVAKGVKITNGHVIDYYNLAQTKDGVKRLENSGVDVDAVIAHVEGDAQLKKYADFLMEKYQELGVEYEPTYVAYTGTPFPSGDFPYYPANASDYSQDFVNEGDLMGDNGSFNMMNATSNNMKAKRNFQGNFNIAMDAHAKYLDYVKNMEHAKHFMPIAKKVNELFSTMNAPHLIKNLGIDDYNDIKTHTARVLSNQNVGGSNTAANILNAIRNFTVIATLGLKPSSLAKQYVGFTHYWVAGIDKGLDPLQIWTGRPTNDNESELFREIHNSDYVKERLTGQHIDVEMRRLLEQAQNSKSAKVWSKVSQLAMAPVRYGDKFALIYGPGGGVAFAVASYRRALMDGMTHEEAKAYALEQFITETELAQQSTRADLTSNIQLDPTFRMLGMYRTGQMAAAKKVVTGMRTIYQANRIQAKEGVEARRAVIPDREIVKSSVDITYYTLFASVFFSAIASGALAVFMGDDEDEKKRAFHDVVMDSVGSTLQGYGMPGFIMDGLLNHMRGDEWKDNVPQLRTLMGWWDSANIVIDASKRKWENIDKSMQKEVFLKQVGSTMNSRQVYDEVTGEYDERAFYNKLTDEEYNKLVKNIGAKNISDFVGNVGKWMKEPSVSGAIDALMNWDTDYMEKNRERGKNDRIFEMFYGVPYIDNEKEYQTPYMDPDKQPDDIFTESDIQDVDVEDGRTKAVREKYRPFGN